MNPSERFKEKATGFSFEEKQEWVYEDPTSLVKDPMTPAVCWNPHLVLYDELHEPRFTLSFEEYLRVIHIKSIQRERTWQSYILHDGMFYWNAKIESERQKEFKQELGIHPSEFILSEFLSRKKEMIVSRKAIVDLRVERGILPTYAGLIERFFYPRPFSTNGFSGYFMLNPERKRVREILGLTEEQRRAFAFLSQCHYSEVDHYQTLPYEELAAILS